VKDRPTRKSSVAVDNVVLRVSVMNHVVSLIEQVAGKSKLRHFLVKLFVALDSTLRGGEPNELQPARARV